MSETIYAETVLAGTSLALGAGLMALYDVFRIWRVLIPHGTLWTGLEDLLYWLLSGVSTFMRWAVYFWACCCIRGQSAGFYCRY